MAKIVNVILSGGSGTRLWPLSRQSQPKQFLPLIGNRESLFQHTLLRNKNLVDEFLLVTNSLQLELGNAQSKALDIPINRKIIEPVGRNTTAAIAMAALSCEPQEILFVTPSDHMIDVGEAYSEAVNKAVSLAQQGFLVTFGIHPRYPETGFGYIEYQHEDVLSFREKPDLETAKQFLSSGDFLWNSGMFCFKASVFLSELRHYCPDIYSSSVKAFNTIINNTPSLETFSAIPDVSVDYAVMERSSIIKVIPSTFVWSDLGSFKSLIDYHIEKQALHGVRPIEGNSKGSYAFSKKKVYALGIDDVVCVETEDCLLIMPLHECQRIKEVYEVVKKTNPSLT